LFEIFFGEIDFHNDIVLIKRYNGNDYIIVICHSRGGGNPLLQLTLLKIKFLLFKKENGSNGFQTNFSPECSGFRNFLE